MSSNESFYSLSARDINGLDVPFSLYKGRVCLVVNTASKGLNKKKLKELQKIQDRYLGKAFQLLAFPCDQFFWQENKRNDKIKNKYQNKLNLSFQIFQRIDVNGGRTHPVYQWLKSKQKGTVSKRIEDNFVKFIIESDGVTVHRLPPVATTGEITHKIDEYLLKCDGSAKIESPNKVSEPIKQEEEEMITGKVPSWQYESNELPVEGVA